MPALKSVHSLDALGTTWVFESDKIFSNIFIKGLHDRIFNFESNFSRFKADSLLTKLNNEKYLRDAPDELISMLQFAREMYVVSEGYFNISVGSQLEKVGYGLKADKHARISGSLLEDLIINGSDVSLSKHTRLDLGGFGKGWLVDSIHDYFIQCGQTDHIINAGGDIRVGTKKQILYVENPFNPQEYIEEFSATDSSLAVSSPLKRSWTHNGTDKNHFINPIGSTHNTIVQVAVRHQKCVTADVLATLISIVPIPLGKRLINTYKAEYLIVHKDSTIVMSPRFKN